MTGLVRRRAASALMASALLVAACGHPAGSGDLVPAGPVSPAGVAGPGSSPVPARGGAATSDGAASGPAVVTVPPLPTAADGLRGGTTGSDRGTAAEGLPDGSAPNADAPSGAAGSTETSGGPAVTENSARGSTGPRTTSPGPSSPPPGTSSLPPATPAPPPATPAPPARRSPPAAPIPADYRHVLGWTGSGRVVSLTFDDGPGPFTGRILDILQGKRVPATFCQIGEQVAAYPSIERRIVALGGALCDHTWDHDEHLSARPTADIDSEMARTATVIESVAGARPVYYRAPGGDFGDPVKRAAARNRLPLLGWAVDTRDWTRPGVDAIVAAVLNGVTPGAIILLHDAGGDRSQTVAALPRIIDALRARGYTFITPPRHPAT